MGWGCVYQYEGNRLTAIDDNANEKLELTAALSALTVEKFSEGSGSSTWR
jgi:hypothetical protein